mmetsp:Transcript_44376/g.128284  ORF Transcript_44376/g.128284 Transcript_44376/m.128284 type:complete len:99 (-) Transcript_44376:64-360(-)
MTASTATAIAKPSASGMSPTALGAASASLVIMAVLAVVVLGMGLAAGVSDAPVVGSAPCAHSIHEDLVTVGGFALGAAVVHLARCGQIAERLRAAACM